MNDQEYEAIRVVVMRAHDKWLAIMALQNWHTLVVFHRDDYPIPQDPDGSNVGSMYIDADWRYLLATIHVNMPALVGLSEERIEQNIVHEFSHCIMNEMHRADQESRDHEERVVTMMALAIVRAYAIGWNDGRADLRAKRKAKTTKKAKAV